MHELGVVFHVIEQVDEIAEENKVKRVAEVTLEIGEVSSIVPHFLTDCWDWAVLHRSKHMKGCKLNLIQVKATSYCESCKKTYPTVPNGRKCPYCGSGETYLVSGNETEIKEIKVED